MKINYLKTVGFRKFKKEFETEIYDITSVTGKNRSEKVIFCKQLKIFFSEQNYQEMKKPV